MQSFPFNGVGLFLIVADLSAPAGQKDRISIENSKDPDRV